MSTIVVVRLLFTSAGIVMMGTTLWMFGMNVSLTSEVMSLRISRCMGNSGIYVDFPTPFTNKC